MLKKNLNKILIVCVAIIWGVLIYKFVNNSYAAENIQDNMISYSNNVIISQVVKDTFLLKGYSKDPFLGEVKNKRTNTLKKKTKNRNTPKPQEANLKWPKIEYLGFVKEEASTNPLLLIKIDDKFFRKRATDEFIEGFKVVHFYKDSIQIRFKNKNKMIKK